MLAAGCSSAEIQAACRWQTDESLRFYARLSAQHYKDLLMKAYGQDFSQIQMANVPRVEMGSLENLLRHSSLQPEQLATEQAAEQDT